MTTELEKYAAALTGKKYQQYIDTWKEIDKRDRVMLPAYIGSIGLGGLAGGPVGAAAFGTLAYVADKSYRGPLYRKLEAMDPDYVATGTVFGTPTFDKYMNDKSRS